MTPLSPARRQCHGCWAVPVALAVAGLVFAADVATPLGIATGAAYVLAVTATIAAARERATWFVAALCTVLTAAGLLWGHYQARPDIVLTNRLLSLLAIWVAAGVLIWHRRDAAARTREIARREAWFRQALEAAPDGMLAVSAAGEIVASNATAERLFAAARGGLLGRPVDELAPDEVRERHARHRGTFVASGAGRAMGDRHDLHARALDGRVFAADIALSVVPDSDGMQIVAVRDVSERRKLEERLRATQRMEAIGRLAGGVAHDFNNSLTVIMAYQNFALDALDDDSPVAEDLREAQKASKHAATVTSQLLAFSRRQVIEPVVVNANHLLAELERMLGNMLATNIELAIMPGQGLWPIEVDPGAFEQVLLNLTINARDAMPHGGRLTVETDNVQLDEAYTEASPGLSPGDYVRLSVSDDGEGMTEDVRVRIFEPFFSTKAPGAGTGLGLATVYGIVRQASGSIWVYSEPGAGTTFKIYFPRASGVPAAAAPRRRSEPPRGGSERLLVVEDQPEVRRMMVRALRRAGYDVLEASNGAEAELRVRELHEPIDLLVTDVVMPQLGGRELAERLQRRFDGLRVLYISGYTENAIVHHGALEPGLVFLQKPFVADVLLERVRQVLDAG